MALAACGSDTGAVTQRVNMRENKRATPLPFAVASVVGSTPEQTAYNTNQTHNHWQSLFLVFGGWGLTPLSSLASSFLLTPLP